MSRNKKKSNSTRRNNILNRRKQKKIPKNLLQRLMNTPSSSKTTILMMDSPLNKRKRSKSSVESSSKRRRNRSKSNSSPIIIHDDTLVTNDRTCSAPTTPHKPTPIHCSTPIIPLPKDVTIINNNTAAVQNFNDEVNNLTKEINRDSYLTIDLTTDTRDGNLTQADTVINLDNSVDNTDCAVGSISNANLSLSGESDITVLNVSQYRKDKQMRKLLGKITDMNTSEKDRLLCCLTENICKGASGQTGNRASETVEDIYIREVIVGKTASRNSIGSNIYNPEKDLRNKTGLRMIVIDGSNVAMEHGRGKVFSVKGLKFCIDYFLQRGHAVKAFVPRFRCKRGKSSDPRLLDELERRGLVVYTPSREIQGRMVTSYDDRYIVQCAAEFDGVIVSGDNYRDLLLENPRWRYVIENRLLPFTWVDDMIMFPKDPLGRSGPTLQQFLKHPASDQVGRR